MLASKSSKSWWAVSASLVVLLLYLAYTHHDNIRESGLLHFRPLTSHSSDDFVSLSLASHVVQPLELSAISNLCQNRKSRNDLIIKCAPGTGGIGNIRSYVLHCVRYAMESGASLVVPRYVRDWSSQF